MLKAESSIVNTYMNVKNEYRRNNFLFLFSDSAVCPQSLETNSLRQHISLLWDKEFLKLIYFILSTFRMILLCCIMLH